MKKILPFALVLFRKLLTSFITAVFCMISILILEIATGVVISSVLEHIIGSFLVFVMILIYITIAGTVVSMISEIVTWKLPNQWRMIVAGIIHLGAAVVYIIFQEKDIRLYVMFLSVAGFYWIVDEAIRFLQDKVLSFFKWLNLDKKDLEVR